jgi:hypothetical protein
MHTKADDASSERIHDYKHPVAFQKTSGFSTEWIHTEIDQCSKDYLLCVQVRSAMTARRRERLITRSCCFMSRLSAATILAPPDPRSLATLVNKCARSTSRSVMAEQGRGGCVQEQDCPNYCFHVIISNSPGSGNSYQYPYRPNCRIISRILATSILTERGMRHSRSYCVGRKSSAISTDQRNTDVGRLNPQVEMVIPYMT